MNITRQEREELNALSKEVFGVSSKWQKLVNKGYSKLITEETTEYVPGATDNDEGTTRKVQVPVKRKDGAHQSTTQHHTLASVRQYMLERKEMLEKIRAEMKRQQDEKKAKEEQERLAKKVHEELQGSAR